MLLYICMVIYSVAVPDPISRRSAIACIISAYSTSKNAPICEIGIGAARLGRLYMPSALPHGHFNPIASVLLSKCLSDN